MINFKNQFSKILEKYKNVENILNKMDNLSSEDLIKMNREYADLKPIVDKIEQYKKEQTEIMNLNELLKDSDQEISKIADTELKEKKNVIQNLENELLKLLIPKDINDTKNSILEIRAGTGGEEAALFAANLYRIYTRYAERNNWVLKILNSTETGIGGIKEAIVSVKGDGAFGRLKYESGVHRVQRVPKTETSGRVHTSAATVAILPEAEDVDIDIKDSDLKIDTYRASGAGGQHVNKTESAIRITHKPSGLVVTCQDESSQHKNRAAALKVLKSRLLAMQEEKVARARSAERKVLVSTGDRSAKIRTYNFPQGRVTDHRISFTSHRLNEILDGDIEEIIEKLKLADQQSIMDTQTS